MALLPFIQNDIYLPIYSEHFDFLCIQFSQMNDILGEDYEKKMATVSVLKQYAEDRDVEMLGRALKAIINGNNAIAGFRKLHFDFINLCK
jgi:hypothetical protein